MHFFGGVWGYPQAPRVWKTSQNTHFWQIPGCARYLHRPVLGPSPGRCPGPWACPSPALRGLTPPIFTSRVDLLPCPALPCPVLPCPALPCPALPCPVLPCPALPCPALPCPALPCPALPCPALPCPALSLSLPCPALPCPALPCPAWLCCLPALPCCPCYAFEQPSQGARGEVFVGNPCFSSSGRHRPRGPTTRQ